jgi:hypothetical protein
LNQRRDRGGRKVEHLGVLATAVFERVAGAEGDAKGLFCAEALAGHAAVVGREVRAGGL